MFEVYETFLQLFYALSLFVSKQFSLFFHFTQKKITKYIQSQTRATDVIDLVEEAYVLEKSRDENYVADLNEFATHFKSIWPMAVI